MSQKEKAVKYLRCAHCSKRATFQCDFTTPILGMGVPMSQWPRCNAGMCAKHTQAGPDGNRFFCPLHRVTALPQNWLDKNGG